MKIITSKILMALMAFVFSTNLSAQQDDVELTLLNYLSGYCDEGEASSFADFIRDSRDVVEPLLINYVQEGVPKEMIDSLESTIVIQYNDRQKMLSQDLNFGLSKEELEVISNETQEEFSQRMLQEFRRGFMSQTIFGLSLIGSEEAQELINKIAADEKNPNQQAALNALNKVYLKR